MRPSKPCHEFERGVSGRPVANSCKNRSDFMLKAACDKAQEVVLDQVFFALDAEKFKQFTALLDAPVVRNPGLERLLAVKPPWQHKVAKA